MRYAILMILLFATFAQGELLSKVEEFEPFFDKGDRGIQDRLPVSLLKLSPDGTRLAVAHSSVGMYGIAVYDTATRKKIWRNKKIANIGPITGIKLARFTPNGSLCVLTQMKFIWEKRDPRRPHHQPKIIKKVSYLIVFDPKGEVLHKREVDFEKGNFSPDGVYFYIMQTTKKGRIRQRSLAFLNVRTGDVDKRILLGTSAGSPVFSHDMTRVCFRGGKKVRGKFQGELKIYDMTTMKQIKRIAMHQLSIRDVAFSKDGSSLLIQYTKWRRGVSNGYGLVAFHIQSAKQYNDILGITYGAFEVSSKSTSWSRLLFKSPVALHVMDITLKRGGLSFAVVYKLQIDLRISNGRHAVAIRDNILYFVNGKIYKATLTEVK